MPFKYAYIYTYQCKSCGDERDYLVPKPEANPLECDSCHKPGRLERAAVQAFSVGSHSQATSINLQRMSYENRAKYMRATGATEILKITANTPNGPVHALDAWGIPKDHSGN